MEVGISRSTASDDAKRDALRVYNTLANDPNVDGKKLLAWLIDQLGLRGADFVK